MASPFLLLFLFIYFIGSASSARILVLFPVGSKSHKFAVMPIVEELANRGHQMTVITPYTPTRKVENIHEIILEGVAEVLERDDINWFELQKGGATQVLNMMTPIKNMLKLGYDAMMKNAEFRTILEERRVDLIFFDAIFNEFALSVGDHLKVPCAMHSSNAGFPLMTELGLAADYATIPSLLVDFSNRMNFFQRLSNMLITEIFVAMYKSAVIGTMEELVQRDFPDSRPIMELIRESNLVIINSHPSTAWPRPLPPSVVPIGALHTRSAKPLSDVRNIYYIFERFQRLQLKFITMDRNLEHLRMRPRKD